MRFRIGGPRLSIIPGDAALDARLQSRDLQTLCVFGRYTDKKGWCTRSQVKMSREMGIARSTLQLSIERLVSTGYLEKRVTNGAPGERDAPHEYRVILDPEEDVQEGENPLEIGASPPAGRSAPPADWSAGQQYLPADPIASAPPADPIASAPMNDSSRTKKDARARLPASGAGSGIAIKATSFIVSENPKFVSLCLRLWSQQSGRDKTWMRSNNSVSIPADIVDAARRQLGNEGEAAKPVEMADG